jgi:hypothetical protein
MHQIWFQNPPMSKLPEISQENNTKPSCTVQLAPGLISVPNLMHFWSLRDMFLYTAKHWSVFLTVIRVFRCPRFRTQDFGTEFIFELLRRSFYCTTALRTDRCTVEAWSCDTRVSHLAGSGPSIFVLSAVLIGHCPC